MILNNSSNLSIQHNMKMYHKIWGEVTVVDFDDQYITLSLNNQQTKKLLLSSIGTHLFYDPSEMAKVEEQNIQNIPKKSEEFRKHYDELGLEDSTDGYSQSIADYEEIDWSMISKPDKTVPEDGDVLEHDVEEEEDLMDHFTEESY